MLVVRGRQELVGRVPVTVLLTNTRGGGGQIESLVSTVKTSLLLDATREDVSSGLRRLLVVCTEKQGH